MFPLGTVLLPGMLVPLHVFEPRYRQMVDDCQADDGTFGVVLIERGSEVGGGDVRTDVGTLARIAEARELPDGRWVLGAVGVERIRVERWLPDDPYPRAEIAAWPDEPGDLAQLDDADAAVRLLWRATALSAELGRPAPPLELALPDDPVLASYLAVAASPLGPADRQHLLATPTVPNRWTLLAELLADQVELLQAQLTGGA
jgi:Lon protease-like protein